MKKKSVSSLQNPDRVPSIDCHRAKQKRKLDLNQTEMIKTILKLQMFFAPQFPTLTVFTDVRCYINILFIVCDLWNSLDSPLHQTSVLIEYITEVAAL